MMMHVEGYFTEMAPELIELHINALLQDIGRLNEESIVANLLGAANGFAS